MIKRLAAFILAAALLLGLCGCGSIFDKEYSSVTDYVPSGDSAGDGKNTVRNYYSLKQTILSLVDGHKESGTAVFDGYDGDISTDLKSACWELRTQNALCAYCVDSIDYELNRIVSYDEATIYIKYSRSQAEIDKVVTVSYSTGIKEYLLDAMNKFSTEAVLLVNNSALDEDGVKEMAGNIYMEDPLCAVTMPAVTVHMYSGSGLQRLFDITIDYGEDARTLAEKKNRISEYVKTAAKVSADDSQAKAAFNACRYIVGRCAYSTSAGKNTVYDALVSASADSQGMALAYKAVCDALGVSCQVVKGLKNQNDHWWDIIELDGEHYHADVSVCRTDGLSAGFLRSDVDMWNTYRWDTAAYPECRGTLTFDQVTK